MGHKRGMIDQAFHAAQAFGEREQVRALEESSRAFEICFQNDRDHSAETAHLGTGEIVLRMRFQSWVTDRLHLRLFFEPARDLERISAMPFHSQRKRFQTAQYQKTIERPGDRTDRILQKPHSVAEFLVITT